MSFKKKNKRNTYIICILGMFQIRLNYSDPTFVAGFGEITRKAQSSLISGWC